LHFLNCTRAAQAITRRPNNRFEIAAYLQKEEKLRLTTRADRRA